MNLLTLVNTKINFSGEILLPGVGVGTAAQVKFIQIGPVTTPTRPSHHHHCLAQGQHYATPPAPAHDGAIYSGGDSARWQLTGGPLLAAQN